MTNSYIMWWSTSKKSIWKRDNGIKPFRKQRINILKRSLSKIKRQYSNGRKIPKNPKGKKNNFNSLYRVSINAIQSKLNPH